MLHRDCALHSWTHSAGARELTDLPLLLYVQTDTMSRRFNISMLEQSGVCVFYILSSLQGRRAEFLTPPQ